jgi:small subunit ribosomal protein S20
MFIFVWNFWRNTMAHTKSARKRIRQDRKRHVRNQSVKTRIRNLTKDFRAKVEESDSEKTAAALKDAIRALDKAASKGVLHRKTASRKVGRLTRAVHRKESASAAEAPTSTS